MNVKILCSVLVVLATGAASISTANAHDSFSLGINVGDYDYAPQPVVYYQAPAAVYYEESVVYYRPAPRYYNYAPVLSFGSQNYGNRDYGGGWGN